MGFARSPDGTIESEIRIQGEPTLKSRIRFPLPFLAAILCGMTMLVSAVPAGAILVTPSITSISPAKGAYTGGTSTTITGTGFSGATVVEFGNVSAPFKVVSDTEVTTTSPAVSGAGTVRISVTTLAGTSRAVNGDVFTDIYQGYWLVARDGGIFSLLRHFYGSTGSLR